jgi:hypothetical protein
LSCAALFAPKFLAKNKTKFLAKHNKKIFGKHLTLHPAGRSPQKTHGVNEALVGQSALVLVAGKQAAGKQAAGKQASPSPAGPIASNFLKIGMRNTHPVVASRCNRAKSP